MEKKNKEEKEKGLLVDPIHVILCFDGDTGAPLNLLDLGRALRALEVSCTVEPVARVDDDARLVRAQLCLDPRKGARERDHGGVGGSVVDQEVPVVALAGAARAAVAREAGQGSSVAHQHVRAAGEVVDAVRLRRLDLARR